MAYMNVRIIVRQLSGFLADELSKQTGETWTVDTSEKWEGHESTHINGPDQQVIVVRRKMREYSANFQRIEISGCYPDGYGNNAWDLKEHKISVARDRAVEAIAKEIVRRLLPDYRKSLVEVVELMAKAAESEANKEAAIQRLLSSLGGSNHSGTIWAPLDGHWAKIRVLHGGKKAELDVHSLPIETVERMMRAAADA
ncbi:hypothetical protein OG474_30560 [Kribbella sp. NBC_01505]|uniref:hypothetical protein n=1 Tax=Kribbella sp. NBC_01505 TaxID=2903580 RepID=UPI00386C5DD1